MDPLDFSALFSSDEDAARQQRAALTDALRQRRAAGTLGTILGGPFAASGKQFSGEANDYQNALQTAAQFQGLHGEQLRQQAEARNPASTQSLIGRQLAGQLGLEVPEGTPYSGYESLLPEATKALQAKAMAAYHGGMLDLGNRRVSATEQALQLKGLRYNPVSGQIEDLRGRAGIGPSGAVAAPRRVAAPASAGAAQPATPDTGASLPPQLGQIGPLEPPNDKRMTPLLDSFKKDLDAASASSRSAFGQSANVVFRGARNLALLKRVDPATGQPQQLTNPEWQEIAAGLLAMQTGGVPTERMMKEGIPRDIQGNSASIMSWLTSNPHAPDRQQWIDRFISNVDREEKAALDFQRKTQLERLPAHSTLFSLFPNRAKMLAQGYGIDPTLIDEIRAGRVRPAPGGMTTAPAPAAGPRQISSDAEYNALPSGTEFIGPDGKHRRKP